MAGFNGDALSTTWWWKARPFPQVPCSESSVELVLELFGNEMYYKALCVFFWLHYSTLFVTIASCRAEIMPLWGQKGNVPNLGSADGMDWNHHLRCRVDLAEWWCFFECLCVVCWPRIWQISLLFPILYMYIHVKNGIITCSSIQKHSDINNFWNLLSSQLQK